MSGVVQEVLEGTSKRLYPGVEGDLGDGNRTKWHHRRSEGRVE